METFCRIENMKKTHRKFGRAKKKVKIVEQCFNANKKFNEKSPKRNEKRRTS